jgi:hypothetical protein
MQLARQYAAPKKHQASKGPSSILVPLYRLIVEDASLPQQQVIMKFLNRSRGEGLASVVGAMQDRVVGIGSVGH